MERVVRKDIQEWGKLGLLLTVLLALLVALCPAPLARAASGFSDVSPNAWYVQGGYLDYVVDNGIMTGIKNPDGTLSGKFEPEGSITRGQVATILYRIVYPNSTATTIPADYGRYSSFSDVRTSYYYTTAIEWCYNRGIVTGYKDPSTQQLTGKFGPEDPVTREQLATMLYRFATQQLGYTKAAAGNDVASMSDSGRIQPFAKEAMRWCYARGILTGSVLPDGALLLPRGEATRAQTAKMVTAMLTSGEPTGEAWAILYEDGTLMLQRGADVDPAHGDVLSSWGNIESGYGQPWSKYAGRVKSVIVRDPVALGSSSWFSNMSRCESADLANLDTSGVKSMSGMFGNCSSLGSLDLSSWDVSSVMDMYAMFSGCSSLSSLDLTGWNTSTVQNMQRMFSGCSALSSLDLSNWDVSSVGDMVWMFDGCFSLTDLNVSGWNTFALKKMSFMFYGCSSLLSLNLSGWDVYSVSALSYVFSGCSSMAALDLSGWDVSAVTEMKGTFSGCSSLVTLDLSGWDTSKVLDSSSMFFGCSSLTTVSLGEGFTLASGLPVPLAVEGSTGLWYDADGNGYRPVDIPVGVAGTYTAVSPVPLPEPEVPVPDIADPTGNEIVFCLYSDDLLEVDLLSSMASFDGVASYWILDQDDVFFSRGDIPWTPYVSGIRRVRVGEGVRPSSCAHWFAGMENCEIFDLTGLDTSACSNFEGMFEDCSQEAELVLGPLFSIEGDGSCAPCRLPQAPNDVATAVEDVTAEPVNVEAGSGEGEDAAWETLDAPNEIEDGVSPSTPGPDASEPFEPTEESTDEDSFDLGESMNPEESEAPTAFDSSEVDAAADAFGADGPIGTGDTPMEEQEDALGVDASAGEPRADAPMVEAAELDLPLAA